jgi:hypothetical protein
VNVYAMFENAIIPDDRNRRGFRIGPVLIDRQAAAVTDQPRCLGHSTKDSPTFADDHPTSL